MGGGWLGCRGGESSPLSSTPGFGMLCWLLFPQHHSCVCVFIVCLGSYQSLYPLVMRQDRSLCQHSQHIQPRMWNVSSSRKNCTAVFFTVSCSVLMLLHVRRAYLFIALYKIHSCKSSTILLLSQEPFKTRFIFWSIYFLYVIFRGKVKLHEAMLL